jgi:hypothetical protein
MDRSEKVREDRVRRMLARQGYTLSKSKSRDPRAWDFGVYLITHILAASGTDSGVIAAYCKSLDEAEEWALEGDRAAQLEEASSRPAEDWKEIGPVTVGANWLGQVVSGGGDGPRVLKVLRDRAGKIRFIKGEETHD